MAYRKNVNPQHCEGHINWLKARIKTIESDIRFWQMTDVIMKMEIGDAYTNPQYTVGIVTKGKAVPVHVRDLFHFQKAMNNVGGIIKGRRQLMIWRKNPS